MSDPAKYPPARRRLKSQALIAAAKRELPGMRDAWDYLSESGGHFGWAAFQTSYLPRRLPDGLVHVKITTGPGWRDPKMKLASYGQITELTLIAAVAIAGIIGADPVAAIESIEPPRRTQDREETGDR